MSKIFQMAKRKSKKSKTKFYVCVYIAAALLIAAMMFYVTLPNVSRLKGSTRIIRMVKNLEDTKYLEITYNVGEKNSNFTPLKKVSRHMINAILVAEDIEFYSHKGFNFREIEDSIKKNLEKGKLVRGASTITQQLMKNLYLTGEKTFFRKFKEAILTLKAEHYLSKDRILELYVNVVEWGYGVYGIKMAAKRYFNKLPKNLSPREAAYLAILLPNPRKYSQSKKGSKLEDYLTKKQNTVIWWMQKAGHLDVGEASSKPIQPAPKKNYSVMKIMEKKADKKSKPALSKPKPAKKAASKKEDAELLDTIEAFHPEDVFKETESFKAPADE